MPKKWSKKYKRSIDCNNPKGFSQKAHCAGRKKKENVMSSKLEELVGKPITEEQFDEAAGKKDACYYKVKARYDVWPSAYASGALVKCRKVGAKNWGNKSKKEGVNESRANVLKAIKIAKSMGGNMSGAVKKIEKIQKGLSKQIEVEDALRTANESANEKVLGGKDMTSGIDKNTKITFSKRLPTGYAYLAGKTFKVFKKGINTFNVVPDGSNSEKDAKTLDAPTILKLVKNKHISKIVNSKGKVLSKEGLDDLKALPKDLKKSIKKNREEGVIKENPAAIAAAQRMVVQNKSGNKISVNTARQSSYAQKDPSTHKKAKSLFQRIKDKFKKKESVDEARGTCWVGYQQKGMKEKNGRMVPNCVKEIIEIFYEENGEGHGYTFEHIKETNLNEAEYQGRKVKLGKIMQGDVKKFKVYVKNPKGNVVKVNFGQGGGAKGGTMRIRKSNPKARANFRARHNCDNPGPRHKARYWSCRKW